MGVKSVDKSDVEPRASYPVQGGDRHARSHIAGGKVNAAVYLRAYEVYKYVHGEQKAMIEGGCRGGFSKGELVGFLYASGFPKVEWSQRVDEAFNGMDI